ncbi:MAG TPA: hypothetical protein VH951_00310 [Dehalococcoidia bacterium]
MAGTANRALYRSRQVWHALRPKVDSAELASACTVLNPEQARLFFSMQRRDQRHALEVYGRLRADLVIDRDVLAAALLHDCGKGAVPVWLRILYVLRPPAIDRIAREDAPGMRGAAWRLRHHEAIGARRALAAGSSETTMRFIEGRPLPEEEALFAQLVAADDAS